jgi:hypothetical protein
VSCERNRESEICLQAWRRRRAAQCSDRKLISLLKALIRHKSWTSAEVEQKRSFLLRSAAGAQFYRMLHLELTLGLRVSATTPHRGRGCGGHRSAPN